MTADLVLQRFEREVDRLQRVADSGQAAATDGAIRASDLDYLLASSFQAIYASFETFLEELFFEVLLGRSGIESAGPRVAFGSRPEAERVLLREARAPFLTWLPISNTVKRADTYLTRGRPFNRLHRRGTDLAILDRAKTVRNAIAHNSGAAREQFLRLQMGRLPNSRRSPAGYLQMLVGTTGRSQYEVLVTELRRIARSLAEPKEWRGANLLGPFDSQNSGTQAVRGTYKCTGCGAKHVQRSDAASLPTCSCNPGPCLTCGRQSKSKWERVWL